MVLYPHVLNNIMASGFPGSAYPIMSSVITLPAFVLENLAYKRDAWISYFNPIC